MNSACSVNPVGSETRDRLSSMRATRTLPAATLLRRYGCHHRKVGCRDDTGRRVALHLRRKGSDIIEIQLTGGHIARLTNVQAGRLRAALRDVLVDYHRRHCDEAAGLAIGSVLSGRFCGDLT